MDMEVDGEAEGVPPLTRADGLAADAMAQDMMKWIIYDPANPTEPLDQWLMKNKPSQVSRSEYFLVLPLSL